jgi:ferredoxin-fold anticodon binding domain-containing protein
MQITVKKRRILSSTTVTFKGLSMTLKKTIYNKEEAENLAKELLAASLTLRAIYEINLEQRNEKDPHYLQT